MKYTFKEYDKDSLYSNDTVFMLVVGKYPIFNDLVCNKLRESCKGAEMEYSQDIFDEFNLKISAGDAQISNRVDLETFMGVVNSPCVSGRWYCNTPLSTLTKKQIAWVETYIKRKQSNGLLVLTSEDFKEFLPYLKNKILANSLNAHLIQLSWPTKQTLAEIAQGLFEKNHIGIGAQELETFIFRMSSSYNEYDNVISDICSDYTPGYTLTKKDLLNSMKGINNCVLDDYIEKMLVPFLNDTPTNRKKIFKMLGALLSEYGAQGLVTQLLRQINIYIAFRTEINKGTIPVLIKYSLVEVRNKLGKDHPLAKISDYRFRKMAFIASRTTLQDWVYMRLILSNTSVYNKNSYEEALYRLTVRSILNPYRLEQDIGLGKWYWESPVIAEIDSIAYDKDKLARANEIQRRAYQNET